MYIYRPLLHNATNECRLFIDIYRGNVSTRPLNVDFIAYSTRPLMSTFIDISTTVTMVDAVKKSSWCVFGRLRKTDGDAADPTCCGRVF